MKRNKFNLSHYKLGSADMGKLYPISCFEVLPGDTVQMHSSLFLRFAPMVAPVMHPVKVSTYSFFVPFRLLWNNGTGDNWEDFITGGPDGLDTSTPPTYTNTEGINAGTVQDYLGVPIGYTGPYSALPYRAYAQICNEYFRDQDLVDKISQGDDLFGGDEEIGASSSAPNGFAPFELSWEKDYFTTCRPWPQKGPTVTVPVNGITPSTVTGKITGNATGVITRDDYTDSSSNTIEAGASSVLALGPDGNDIRATQFTPFTGTAPRLAIKTKDLDVSVSIPGNSSASVRLDDLREAFAIQRFEEHRSVYGSRYTEYLRYLGVRARDSRLQRPEYLGGGKSTIQFSEVLQTAAAGDNPVGTLRGHGIGVNRGRTFRRFIEEHGLIMTLMAIRPIAIYMNGLNKMFSRQTKEDYWQKELQHIGQKEVLSKELYATGDITSTVNDNSVFGYQNQYDEYRSVPSTVCGEMRNTLDYWHLGRSFGNRPVLNASFIQGSPSKRIFAEQTMNEIYFMAQHSVVVRRLMSKMGNPIM